ncbi:MAG: signal peptidase II [Clostridia bacterium]|nr:signal peptidase II [Clostridia bacterium]
MKKNIEINDKNNLKENEKTKIETQNKLTKNSIFKSLIIKISLIFLAVGLDLLTKNFFYKENVTIIPNVIGVRSMSSLNTGGAWGILSENLGLLILITIIFLAFVVAQEIIVKNTDKLFSVAFGLIVGGAIGNFIDRIFLGGVRDFIFFEFFESFPTFNLADSFLCVGMIILAIYILFFYKPKEKINIDNKTKSKDR